MPTRAQRFTSGRETSSNHSYKAQHDQGHQLQRGGGLGIHQGVGILQDE